jgi:hypothetical protein
LGLPSLIGGGRPKAVPVADVSGLPVINITSSPFNADPSGNTDSTAAIVAAIAAAGKTGRIYAPEGVYLITGGQNDGGPITFSGAGTFEGAGAALASTASTVFRCGDTRAGFLFTGNGLVANFTIDGNSVATTPMQRGEETGGGSFGTFMNVAVINSAQDGWTIISAQNDSYYSCLSQGSARDNLYIDGGAGGLDFFHWHDAANGRFGIRSDGAIEGMGGTYGGMVECVRFWGGITEGGAINPTSRIFLRHAVDWSFPYMNIVGIGCQGPTVTIDQSTCYDVDLSNTRIWANKTNGGASPGFAGVAIDGHATYGGEFYFDNAYFVEGDTSIYVASAAPFLSAAGIMDHTINGPMAANGVQDINTLLLRRVGAWQTAALGSGWQGAVEFRSSGFGRTEFKGTMTGPTGTSAFTLPVGYRPMANATLVAAIGAGVGSVAVAASSGNVTVAQGSGQSSAGVSLDGLSVATS